MAEVTRVTQTGFSIVAEGDPDIRVTQSGFNVIAASRASARVTQSGFNVIGELQFPRAPTLTVTELPGALSIETSQFEAADSNPTDIHLGTTYEITLSTDPTFSSPVETLEYEDPDAGLTFIYVPTLSALTTYLIRAKHTGVTGGDSPWSVVAEATTLADTTKPTTPTVTIEDYGQDFVEAVSSAFAHVSGTTTREAFDPNNPLPYLAAVQWQLRETVSGTVVYDSGLIQPITRPAEFWEEGLDAGKAYQLRVLHFDGYFNASSDWSSWAAFTTDSAPAQAPNAPALTVTNCDAQGNVTAQGAAFSHPDGGATHAATRWRAAHQYGDVTSFVTTDPTELTEYSWTDLPAGLWTFDVSYQDDSGRWGTFGTSDTCTVLEEPPPPEFNHYGSTRICADTLLTWDMLPVPTGPWLFQAQLSDDDGATWTTLFSALSDEFWTFSIAGRSDGVYLFRLRARYASTAYWSEWAYMVLRLDRSCSETTVYDFATITNIAQDQPDWEVLWDTDDVEWTPVNDQGEEGGGFGILGSGSVDMLRQSVLAFKELGQPTLYEAEVEFVLMGRECMWYMWRWANMYAMRGGLAYAATGKTNDGDRAGVISSVNCGNSPWPFPPFGGSCPNGQCYNPCVCAHACVCSGSIGANVWAASVLPNQLVKYGIPGGNGTVRTWGYKPGASVHFHYDDSAIPHVGSKERGLAVSRRYYHGTSCHYRHTRYILRQKVTRTVTGGIRIRSQVLGPGMDGTAGWTSDEELTWEEVQDVGCGYVGLSSDFYRYWANEDPGIIFTSFAITPSEYDDCLPPPDFEEPESAVDTVSRPCVVILQVYEEDRETLAWEVGDYAEHPNPYLCVLENYGEQEIDVVNGAATIGQVEVVVIDRRQTEGDQDSGWLTERLASGGVGIIHGRRCRVIRYIDEDQGWVVIADGPASTPRMDESYSAYRWSVRDTRETERKVKAFSETNDCWVVPMGVPDGFYEHTDLNGADQWLVPPVDPIWGTFELRTTSWGIPYGRVDCRHYWPSGPGAGNTVGEELVVTEQVGQDLTCDYNLQGDPYPFEMTWPDFEVLWRARGTSDPWTVVQPYNYVPPSGGHVQPDLAGPEYEAQLADGTEVIAVLGLIWLQGYQATGTFPTDGQEVEVAIRYKGSPSERYPYYVDGITTGQFLKKLYDGEYSRVDPVTGAFISTGIRYNEADLLQMTDPIHLRLTEAVDDARTWAEKLIYAPTGWCPALNNDGEISPVSQVPPDDLTGLTEINDAITEPSPDWDAGERIVNVLRFEYPRYYRVAIEDAMAIDLLEARDIELEYRSELSITNHAEKKVEYDGSAFSAPGDAGGSTIRGLTSEIGYLHAENRELYVFDRYKHGAASWSVPVMRDYTAMLRAGTWVTTDLSWLPDYLTQRRGQETGGQILAVHDVDCKWRILLIEEAFPLDEGS